MKEEKVSFIWTILLGVASWSIIVFFGTIVYNLIVK